MDPGRFESRRGTKFKTSGSARFGELYKERAVPDGVTENFHPEQGFGTYKFVPTEVSTDDTTAAGSAGITLGAG